MSDEPPASAHAFKAIGELLDHHFLVRDYQRGYKWRREEVTDLLDDIDDFSRRHPSGDALGIFYCLQPVVVKRLADSLPRYELIDGQQRFTTLYLILAYFQSRGVLTQRRYQLEYQTRSGSAEFLAGIADAGITDELRWQEFLARHARESGAPVDNIDNFHLFEAYRAIVGWFGKSGASPSDFCRDLLGRCRVIWYEPQAGPSAEEVFVRLNSGKIPLTSAELIKALFLQDHTATTPSEALPLPDHPAAVPAALPEYRRHEIAQQWDGIEYALQGDAFWGFIHKAVDRHAPPTRIDFLFDLISGRKAKSDPKHSFRYYANLAKVGKFAAAEEWERVRSRFQYLREWYDDAESYHLLGFLITRGVREVNELLEEAAKLTKTDFARSIRESVCGRMRGHAPLAELQYGEDDEELHDVLLLFNLHTILGSRSATRFPFERYRQITRSLEHIHAQNAEKVPPREKLRQWHADFRRRLGYLEGERTQALRRDLEDWQRRWKQTSEESIDAARESLEADSAKMEKEFDTLLAATERGDSGARTGNLRRLTDEELHGLGNLALLGRDENASLNNSLFRDKRRQIIVLDRRGEFIPDATLNVFLKYYSREDAPQTDLWGPVDCESYLDAIAEALAPYGVRKTSNP